MSPAQFIPLAEEIDLILPIGQWVLETACAAARALGREPPPAHLQLAVNVSARQFRQPTSSSRRAQVMQRTAINPQRLKLELTESLLLDDIDDTISR